MRKTEWLGVRLEPELAEKLDVLCRETDRDRSKVIRLLIRLAQAQKEPDIILRREVEHGS